MYHTLFTSLCIRSQLPIHTTRSCIKKPAYNNICTGRCCYNNFSSIYPENRKIFKTTKKLDKCPFVYFINGPRSMIGTRIWPPYTRDCLIRGYVINRPNKQKIKRKHLGPYKREIGVSGNIMSTLHCNNLLLAYGATRSMVLATVSGPCGGTLW